MIQGNFSLGFWRLDDAKLSINETDRLIKTALENGISVMDHADIYGAYKCEKLFGDALKDNMHLRDEMTIVSKCGIKFACDYTPNNIVKHYDLSKESIEKSVNDSLKNMHIDNLDLLLVHRPSPLMNFDEIAQTFENLRKQGKVKDFGVSNFTKSQFEALNSCIELKTNQVECSVLNNNALYDGTLDQAQQLGFRPMIWSPLAGGSLFNPKTSKEILMIETLKEMSSKYNCTIDQLAFAWLLKLPSNPMPILGTQKIDRVVSAIKSANINIELQDWFKILEVSNGCEAP